MMIEYDFAGEIEVTKAIASLGYFCVDDIDRLEFIISEPKAKIIRKKKAEIAKEKAEAALLARERDRILGEREASRNELLGMLQASHEKRTKSEALFSNIRAENPKLHAVEIARILNIPNWLAYEFDFRCPMEQSA